MFKETPLNVVVGLIVGAGLTAGISWLIAEPPVVHAQHEAMLPPSSLNLAGSIWVVQLVDYPGDSPSTFGYTDCATHTIQINRVLDNKAETLVHEVLHAYVCIGPGMINNDYYNSEPKSHDGIDRAAYVIEDALRRNPALALYLGERTLVEETQ